MHKWSQRGKRNIVLRFVNRVTNDSGLWSVWQKGHLKQLKLTAFAKKSAFVSIRQHTSEHVNIHQNTSTHVSGYGIRQQIRHTSESAPPRQYYEIQPPHTCHVQFPRHETLRRRQRHTTSQVSWISFNSHLKKFSVIHSDRPDPTYLKSSDQLSGQVLWGAGLLLQTLSSHDVVILQGHRYLESPILGVQRRLRVKSRHPDSQNPHL